MQAFLVTQLEVCDSTFSVAEVVALRPFLPMTKVITE